MEISLEQIVYVDGAFVPAAEAKVSVFDRGFLFADGIYEVSAVLDGKLIDNDSHLARLAQVLAKQAAAEAGCQEAWMIEDGKVTEGGSSSAFILTQDNVLVTRENSSAILPGCTRKAVTKLAEEHQVRVEERAFSVKE